MYGEAKKEMVVHVKCLVSGHIDRTIMVAANKYGWFDMSDSFCPVCFLMLEKVVDGRNVDDNRS